jgi:hypothetical protein
MTALAFAGGCGSSPNEVSGKITFAGQPLPAGTIFLVDEQGLGTPGLIGDGQYVVPNVHPGPVKIAVRSEKPLPHLISVPSDEPGKPPQSVVAEAPPEVKIPSRYNDEKQSGLTYTVVAGRQTHDIDLQP